MQKKTHQSARATWPRWGFPLKPQKAPFRGSAHQEYCPLWGGVGLAWPCPGLDTRTVLLPLFRAHLYHYYT